MRPRRLRPSARGSYHIRLWIPSCLLGMLENILQCNTCLLPTLVYTVGGLVVPARYTMIVRVAWRRERLPGFP